MVDVSPAENGDVRIDTAIPDSYPFTISHTVGTTVKLTAIPSSGYAFLEWGGDADGNEVSITLSPTCDTAVTAIFTPAQSAFAWWWLPVGIGTTSLIILVYFRFIRRAHVPASLPDTQMQ
jgi:hypothetical protein